jgi:uncharacterized protein
MQRAFYVFGLLALVVLLTHPAAAERRVALVMGNSKYVNEAPLSNPGNDAGEMAAALKRIRFDEVRTPVDGDQMAMQSALGQFAKLADGADLAIVYHSGHGIEVDGKNYLIPTSAKLADASDVEFETVPIELAIAAADRASQVKLIILDACRSNPFQARMMRQSNKRSVGRGFAPIASVGKGMLIAYAARAGTVADDGPAGGNSPYTKALLQFIEQPKVEVRLSFGLVRDEVVTPKKAAAPVCRTDGRSAQAFSDSQEHGSAGVRGMASTPSYL